ncbi:hypothetical protein GOP47_0011296 [Adiantum capillus-veneris]|uniref:Uncharacterized protein n=1 Tax=Adiantum capillus-veneris TaxID=13818 RepID=A0A9D4ZF99_ADICA|nr:hypothetical protein GOP47_0011296 [Adiantum capillus-veneris]
MKRNFSLPKQAKQRNAIGYMSHRVNAHASQASLLVQGNYRAFPIHSAVLEHILLSKRFLVCGYKDDEKMLFNG